MLDQIINFFHSYWAEAIAGSVLLLVEYWLGKTDKVKPGSTLEVVLSGVKKVLELLGFKAKPDDSSILPKDK